MTQVAVVLSIRVHPGPREARSGQLTLSPINGDGRRSGLRRTPVSNEVLRFFLRFFGSSIFDVAVSACSVTAPLVGIKLAREASEGGLVRRSSRRAIERRREQVVDGLRLRP